MNFISFFRGSKATAVDGIKDTSLSYTLIQDFVNQLISQNGADTNSENHTAANKQLF
jgi:hypothetical protein